MLFLTKEWRVSKLMIGLLIAELPITIALLALFGIASPDLYRTLLWEEGSKQGWNSNPNQILYALANHETIEAPTPWNSFTTNFNLVISVLSMFLLLTKTTMHIMNIFWPIFSVLLHAGLAGIYAYSVYAQSAPDNSDAKHPTNGPCWYITMDCNVASSDQLVGYCQQAKSSFIVTCLMLALFCVQVIYASWCCIPTKTQKLAHKEKREEKLSEKERMKSLMEKDVQHQWELHNFPQTPGTAGGMKSPGTPRTMAYNSLGGFAAPSGSAAADGSVGRGGSAGRGHVRNFSRDLPLRERTDDIQEV